MGFRRFVFSMLGAKYSAAITVGSEIRANGRQNVALSVSERGKHLHVALTSDGARRIARQIHEWADTADAHNDKLDQEKTVQRWQYVVEKAVAAKELEEAAGARGLVKGITHMSIRKQSGAAIRASALWPLDGGDADEPKAACSSLSEPEPLISAYRQRRQ